MKELRIEMIPAYSPQARGRGERNFKTWQGRLPQELRRRHITTLEAANAFLMDSYIAEFNGRFIKPAAQQGTAFVPAGPLDMDRIFSLHHQRVVNADNTVRWGNTWLQIESTRWRSTLARCHVLVLEHLDDTLTIYYGPHIVGRYRSDGQPLETISFARQRGRQKELAKKKGANSFSKAVTSAARSSPR